MVNVSNHTEEAIWQLLETVKDPEVPVLSVVDLGIVRKVIIEDENTISIAVTPTYSGCPAMDVIRMQLRILLLENGFKQVNIQQVLSPAWTTDWMSEKGKEQLKAYGIAPPLPKQTVCHPDAFQEEEAIQCPYCLSYHTRLVSRFGSTACKALYQCLDCKEPFDYFKCH
ncbi:MAG: phenylacetate-CoA oxygenase subunit PaaJ [Hydrotalea flava]|uniref:1,2-phenylacetyl-CoA epoxidase subunit PaaD n=1 Tax=Hydrotalea TaxID=1004300 RepID=UPI00094528D2|nr:MULTISPECIES: 1,2-phenylacetyl-CoA epoxidase subunit PaaD [Hydrotalea]MBY0348416.1 phenylacetate-CoA oxygenase subunit PaaJ [Hydrotalea flava]NIM36057.1 phenylacetate-CoA oxygenase subunit PaaJ [Hydrotalea flava]NIM38904.1 phenylacetate-CoA oxygenase subunit PaaJ [Hydrotalea flava]NIN04094.1 phenylacetate-CoA oxygenase subunit PaaJ [Hydrotalea flava]NIN15537.1 phenylacetate-CoA oxygenase subunit PaaJ [Hydrotalea flava]